MNSETQNSNQDLNINPQDSAKIENKDKILDSDKNNDKASAPEAAKEETQEQINWRKFREAREKERKEKIEAEKRAAEKEKEVAALKAAMEALVSKPDPTPPSYSYEEPNEEERIQKLVEESLKKEREKIERERAERERQEFPQKLAQDFRDFDKVCTSENLDYLEYHFPDVAEAFKAMPDGYNKWARVYGAVKKLVPSLSANRDAQRAEQNLSRPQSMSIPGKTAVGDSAPVKLDDKRKAENWARMVREMKGGVR